MEEIDSPKTIMPSEYQLSETSPTFAQIPANNTNEMAKHPVPLNLGMPQKSLFSRNVMTKEDDYSSPEKDAET